MREFFIFSAVPSAAYMSYDVFNTFEKKNTMLFIEIPFTASMQNFKKLSSKVLERSIKVTLFDYKNKYYG